jgi:hypothetical protein
MFFIGTSGHQSQIDRCISKAKGGYNYCDLSECFARMGSLPRAKAGQIDTLSCDERDGEFHYETPMQPPMQNRARKEKAARTWYPILPLQKPKSCQLVRAILGVQMMLLMIRSLERCPCLHPCTAACRRCSRTWAHHDLPACQGLCARACFRGGLR